MKRSVPGWASVRYSYAQVYSPEVIERQIFRLMKTTLLFLNLLFFIGFQSMNDKEEEEILRTLLSDISRFNENSYVMLECRRLKTFFDKKSFISQTGLVDIPEKALNELEENSKKLDVNKERYWKKDVGDILKDLNDSSNFLEFCISEQQKCQIFDGKIKPPGEKTPVIVSIDAIVLDESKSYGVVSVIFSRYHGAFVSRDYFLAKVEGNWTVIGVYNYVIT